MARKRKFLCHPCEIAFKSAAESSRHFHANPDHRDEKQQRSYEQNQKDKAKNGRTRRKSPYSGSLPTMATRTKATRNTAKFCTHCGASRKPTHTYCGG